jgi:hypothetical protein
MRPRRFCYALPSCAALAGVMLASSPARGDVWTLEPRLSTTAVMSSNPQLAPQPAFGDAAFLDFALATAWDDVARRVELAPEVRLAATGGDYYRNTNAYFLVESAHVQSERSTWSLRSQCAYESLVATVVPAPGTLTRIDVPRRTLAAAPDWLFQVTPRWQTQWTASAESIDYSGGLPYGLYDYRDTALSGLVSYLATEVVQLQAQVGTVSYDYPELNERIHSSYAQLGLSGNWTSQWSYTALYGLSSVARTGAAASVTGSVYTLRLTRAGERGSWSASMVSSYQPSGFGTVTRSTQASVQGTWQYSERSTVAWSLLSAHTSDAFETLTIADRSYRSINLDWGWQASPVWSLHVAPSWQRQNYGTSNGPGTAFGVVLSASRQFGTKTLHGGRS